MSRLLDVLCRFLAHRKELLPLLGCALLLANSVVQMALPGAWISTTDPLPHLGFLTAILGPLLARVL